MKEGNERSDRPADSADGPAAQREPFEAFVEKAIPRLFRAMLMITGDRELAADATQEALACAWRDWHKLRKPAAWVMRVAINYCNRWWRQIGNREVLASSLEDLELTIEDLAEAAPVVESLDPDLLKAIADLSARQRTVVALQDLYGLRPNQIAEVLGIKSSTVSVHYGRAMDALRKRLSDWEEEDGC